MLIAKCIPNNRFFPHQSINTVWMPFKSELCRFFRAGKMHSSQVKQPTTNDDRTNARAKLCTCVGCSARGNHYSTTWHAMPFSMDAFALSLSCFYREAFVGILSSHPLAPFIGSDGSLAPNFKSCIEEKARCKTSQLWSFCMSSSGKREKAAESFFERSDLVR